MIGSDNEIYDFDHCHQTRYVPWTLNPPLNGLGDYLFKFPRGRLHLHAPFHSPNRLEAHSLTHAGTSSIVSTVFPFLPHLRLLSSIVETVVKLRGLGHRVVLVSSGAIGMGLRRMGLQERGKGLSHKQVG